MRKSIGRIATTIVGAASLIAIGTGALASTSHPRPAPPQPQSHCSSLYAAYVGHQTNLAGFSLDTQSGFFFGDQVTGTRHPRDCGQFDFSPLGDGNKAFVLLTSSGTPGAQVIAEIGHHVTVATLGNTDKRGQWTAEPVTGGFEWANAASGDILTIDSHGNVGVLHSGASASPQDTFNFGA